ncbi:MAG: neutral/alkaline non-lysosomal ceramidase N-terminal domain-containing protein [Verrucomicrobia bacterium]|nr:neutral/alkaline non-lysosomal ceramidase N-terminal domain-containing protein [Verrucomicrobiota bacterium]
MKTPSLAAAVIAVFIAAISPCSHAQTLSVGAAHAGITPSTNVLNWVTLKPYGAVLDPLYVRAAVLSDGSNRVALVVWDLTDTRESIVAKVRGEISKTTGIPSSNILINASHSHSAPWVPTLGDPLMDIEKARALPVEHGPDYGDWANLLVSQTVDAVRRADAARRPATLSIARAWAGEVVFNRRPLREDGKVETTFEPANPYALPKGYRFAPTDPTLALLTSRDASDRTIATMFSLPCHSVSVYSHDTRISSDWSGPVCQQLNDTLGGEAMFLQGCAGDIVPARRGLAARDSMAKLVAERGLAAITNRQSLASARFQVSLVQVNLPLTDKVRQEIGTATIRTEVQVIAYGSLAFVALPGEPLIGLALEIQRRSPFAHTLVLGYSNGGGVQYVGPSGDKVKGGYEMTGAGAGADRCGQILIDTALNSLNQLAVEQRLQHTSKESLHLYLLIGQSNMAGRGLVEDQDKVPHPRVLTFSAQTRWQLALDPLHADKSNAGVGLGSAFGRAMADATNGVTIGLIPSAVGGTPLSRWEKGGDLYAQALARARHAMQDGTLKGILWHQGEDDAKEEKTARSYAGRLAQMIHDLRADLGAGEVPFVAGKLGEFLLTTKKAELPFVPTVNEQLQSIPPRISRSALVDSAGLTPMADDIHFDSASLRTFGQRYADTMRSLLVK